MKKKSWLYSSFSNVIQRHFDMSWVVCENCSRVIRGDNTMEKKQQHMEEKEELLLSLWLFVSDKEEKKHGSYKQRDETWTAWSTVS